MPNRPRLTPATAAQIGAAVRAGGFPHVAAASFGVSAELFNAWLERGRRKGAREPYASFAAEIDQALAQARLRAEIDTFNGTPRVWLQHGVGRDSPDNPGWSAVVKPAERDAGTQNILLVEELLALLRTLARRLAAFPEARACVVDCLKELKRRRRAA